MLTNAKPTFPRTVDVKSKAMGLDRKRGFGLWRIIPSTPSQTSIERVMASRIESGSSVWMLKLGTMASGSKLAMMCEPTKRRVTVGEIKKEGGTVNAAAELVNPLF